MDEAAVLEIRHLTKSFRAVAALDDVSLQPLPAAIHVLLGENGAGKTTLMKILGGLIPTSAYEGEILVERAAGQHPHSPGLLPPSHGRGAAWAGRVSGHERAR